MASASNPVTTAYPYETVAFITMQIGALLEQGSGVFITPDEVLTASHVVWEAGVGTATNIKVQPGYEAGTAPFGSSAGTTFHYNAINNFNDRLTPLDSQFDYAVIHLAKPIVNIGTVGLLPDFAGGAVHISGYPAYAAGTQVQFLDTLTLDPLYNVYHGVSTSPGSSGGPVWVDQGGGPQVVGIVSGGNATANTGVFAELTTTAVNRIEAWVTQDDAAHLGAAGVNNTFTLGGGDNFFGGNGLHDTAVFHGARASYSIYNAGDGVLFVTDGVANRDGFDRLTNVQYLHFTDKTVIMAGGDNANVAKLYSAAFNRAPDVAGLNYWEDLYSGHVSAANKGDVYLGLSETSAGYNGNLSIAEGFTNSPEFSQKYGSLSAQAFITLMYANVLGRPPDAAGNAYWLQAMTAGNPSLEGGKVFTPAMVLVGFAESAENGTKAAADWLLVA